MSYFILETIVQIPTVFFIVKPATLLLPRVVFWWNDGADLILLSDLWIEGGGPLVRNDSFPSQFSICGCFVAAD